MRERFFFDAGGPREARGGIRAHSRRGAFGQSWWARRWIAALESSGVELGGRLGRGRNYARRGQVLDVTVQPGRVTAQVQGSRPEPYEVRVEVRTLTERQQRAVATVLRREARFAARLLAGRMPEDVEEAFSAAGLTLFPSRDGDLRTACSCPDWSNPCKHVAAVYYLLGEEFDRDPFLIFRLRGLERDELLALLAAAERERSLAGAAAAARRSVRAAPADPLPADPASFWSRPAAQDDPFGQVQTPPEPAAQLKRLGRFPFWRGGEPIVQALEPVYSRAAARSLDLFAGAAGPARAGRA